MGILYTLLIVVIILGLMFVLNFVAYLFHMPVISYVGFAALIIGATLIIKGKLQNYTYTIEKGLVSIERSTGQNTKLLAEIRVRDIKWNGELKGIPEEYRDVKLQKLTFLKTNSGYVIIYSELDKMRGVIFSPSQEFITDLEQRIIRRDKKLAENESKNQSDEQDREG